MRHDLVGSRSIVLEDIVLSSAGGLDELLGQGLQLTIQMVSTDTEL
jgi:hypothetical protein